MSKDTTDFDLSALLQRVNMALDDSEESPLDTLFRLHDLLCPFYPVKLSMITMGGRTIASLQDKPFEMEDYCLSMHGKLYNFKGQVEPHEIEYDLVEYLLDKYENEKCDPGETWARWEHGVSYKDPIYLEQETEELLRRIVGETISNQQYRALDQASSTVPLSRSKARL